MPLQIQDKNKITTIGEDKNAFYTKTDTYISDRRISVFKEANENIRENFKSKDMQFLGRIPMELFEAVKNGIFEKMTGGKHDAECYLLTKEGQAELDNLTMQTIFLTNDYKYIIAKG